MNFKKIYYFLALFVAILLEAQRPLITTWTVDPSATSAPQFKFLINVPVNYSYVKENDPSVVGSGTAGVGTTISMPSAGNYIFSFTQTAPSFRFKIDKDTGEGNGLKNISQWGDINWDSNLKGLFNNCINLTITATDIPNLTNVTDISGMFSGCTSITTIPSINQWDVSNVTNFGTVFSSAKQFNSDISNWRTGNATNMSGMFDKAEAFNFPLDYNPGTGAWDVSNVQKMDLMFNQAISFNQPLNSWNTSNVENMYYMFCFAGKFNQPLNNWDTGKVTNMSYMFARAGVFNQDISMWNTSNVTNMSFMFFSAKAFNQEIGSWNTAKVTDMSNMFSSASIFNGNIELWDTGNVADMSSMFFSATVFNRPIGNWDTKNVKRTSNMFKLAKDFNQNLANWNLVSLLGTNAGGMFDNSGLTCINYGKTLRGWSQNANIPNNVALGAASIPYGDAIGSVARARLANKGWTFIGDVLDNGCDNDEIVMRWNASANGDHGNIINVHIRANQLYNYTYEKADNPSINGGGLIDGVYWKIQFPEAGQYIVYIVPTAPKFRFTSVGDNTNESVNDRAKLVELIRWSNHSWADNLNGLFKNYKNLDVVATDVPKFSNVTNMSEMFSGCESLTNLPNANLWDVSKVTTMEKMFYLAKIFNGDISQWKTSSLTSTKAMFSEALIYNQPLNTNPTTGAWDMSKVTDISEMFRYAQEFNQPLGAWDVSNVTTTRQLFYRAFKFNQPLNTWVTNKVTDMSHTFYEAKSFNQPLSNWNTSNVTTLLRTFGSALVFNQDLSSWDTHNVTDMSYTFHTTNDFNSDVTTWDTSNVTDMKAMFWQAKAFNQPIGNWKTSKVTNMFMMFDSAEVFNQPINNWDTSAVTSMSRMFQRAGSFNQPLNNWNVANVTLMNEAFNYARSFNQNLGNWELHNNVNVELMLNYSNLDCVNYSLTLKGWANNPNSPVGRTLGAVTLKYGTAIGSAARSFLVNDKQWIISDAGDNGPCDAIACYKPGITTGTASPTPYGITSLGRAGAENGEWPTVRKGAWMALESKTKGFIINRVAFTSSFYPIGMPISHFKVGMVVYDTTHNVLRIYDGSGWKTFTNQTCPYL